MQGCNLASIISRGIKKHVSPSLCFLDCREKASAYNQDVITTMRLWYRNACQRVAKNTAIQLFNNCSQLLLQLMHEHVDKTMTIVLDWQSALSNSLVARCRRAPSAEPMHATYSS